MDNQEKLESAIMEGINSGEPVKLNQVVWNGIRKRVDKRLQNRNASKGDLKK